MKRTVVLLSSRFTAAIFLRDFASLSKANRYVLMSYNEGEKIYKENFDYTGLQGTRLKERQDTNLGSTVQGRGMSKQNGCPAITRWRKFEVSLKSKVIFLHRLFLSSSVIDQYKHTCDTLKTARYLITNTQIHHVCIKLLKVIPTDTEHVFLKKHLPGGRATNTPDARKTGKLKPTFKWIAFRERKLLGNY